VFLSEEPEGRVRILTLCRPDKLNAWHKEMRGELAAALRRAEADSAVAAVLLTGAGEKAFCAGADIAEIAEHQSEEGIRTSLQEWRDFYTAILAFEKPLVVGLNGLAAGSGFQVALLGDMRIGHPGVRMGQVEINSGIPSVTGSLIMAQRLGAAKARELALSGRMIEADEASRLGLLDRIVPPQRVRAEAVASAVALGSQSAAAIRLTKQWFRQMEQPQIDAAFDFAESAQIAALREGDMAERTRRFLTRNRGSN
jgi:enoyl-CoA hydratase/carnithine racemase